jgi:glycosyltransferase involved in cell wall biosynthesis
MESRAGDAPVVLADLDRDSGLVLFADSRGAREYESALVVVRESGIPVGTAKVRLVDGGIPEQTVRSLVDRDWPRAVKVDVAPGSMVSVILCTVDRPDALRRAVQSILCGTYPVHEIVVVDNTPDGRNAALLAELSGHDSRVVPVHCATRGLSASRNEGARHATGSLLAFTDDDILAEREWVAGLVAATAGHDADVVTGLILPAELDTTAQRMCARAGGYGKGFVPRDFRMDIPTQDPLFPFQLGSYGSGANVAVTAQAFARLQGFDEALGAGTDSRGGEDLDLFFRAITEGMLIRYTPAAVIRHTDLRDMDAFARQRFNYGVGLASVLTKMVRDGHSKPMLKRAAPGVRHLVAPSSSRNAEKRGGYPFWLTGLEMVGIAYGPVAHLRAIRGQSRRARRAAP